MKASRKEFIKEAHKAACPAWKEKIEKEFPELFPKNVLEVGKWYKSIKSGALWFVESDTNYGDRYHGYGFNGNGVWKQKDYTNCPENFIPAADEEVKSALIEEAKRRGFKEGAKVVSLATNREYTLSQDETCLLDDGVRMWLYGVCVFDNGKWATTIPQPKEVTLAEVEEKFGCKVKIIG